ncbi:LytTR family DNA-binding domain-containing protein [Rhodobacter sp. NTK016B]|uniref:LytTR family DNA-binding domain-containing protein n=1 Tax=Rhodobacter sp. NTK016B TaxID=2759676 RepID=UPI0025710722|nr:LytTR family DNA-binding domain-containing protein [Rhodobacter sp. NTK016B]
MARRRFWGIVCAAILVTAQAGPFHTMDELNFPGRLGYWGVVILTGALVITPLSFITRQLNRDGCMHWALAATIASAIAAPIMIGLVLFLEIRVRGLIPGSVTLIAIYVAGPMTIVNLVVNGFVALGDREQKPVNADAFRPRFVDADTIDPQAPETEMAETEAAADLPDEMPGPDALPTAVVTPLLFEKLPPELGIDLISLRAQNHYVEVTTTRGTAQILMRLSDAERDLAAYEGMRVHRSWWVNLAHVATHARTAAGGMELTLSDGQKVPVSRSQRAALRAALPGRDSDGDLYEAAE